MLFSTARALRILQIFVMVTGSVTNSVNGQTPAIGACPNMLPMFNIDLHKFQGEWYEVERTFYLFETVGNCIKFNFTLKEDGTMDVKLFMLNRITGNSNTYTGKANPDYFRNPSVMDFRLNSRWTPSPSSWISNRIPSSFTRMLPGSGQYHILNTDYTNYAIMWSCSDMGMLHTDQVWIMGRQQDLDTEKRSEVYALLTEVGIDIKRLVLTKHKNCPSYT